MTQVQSDIDGPAVRDLGSLELALKTMWEKARAAGDMISKLQTEKSELQITVRELERTLHSLRSEMTIKEQDLKKLRAEHAQLSSLDAKNVFSEEEKEMFRVKIKDLISKINSHL